MDGGNLVKGNGDRLSSREGGGDKPRRGKKNFEMEKEQLVIIRRKRRRRLKNKQRKGRKLKPEEVYGRINGNQMWRRGRADLILADGWSRSSDRKAITPEATSNGRKRAKRKGDRGQGEETLVGGVIEAIFLLKC